MTPQTALGRDDLLDLLDKFAAEAERRGVRIEMFVVGGGAMALAYNARRSTGDLDAVFEPKQIAYEIAERVAAEEGRFDLPPDWLNDGVKAFLPGDDPNAVVFYERAGLAVRVASPQYLFVLKAMAARESDEDDLRVLFPLCEFTSSDEALDLIETAYPRQVIKPNVQYLVEQLAAESAGPSRRANDPSGPAGTGGAGDRPTP